MKKLLFVLCALALLLGACAPKDYVTQWAPGAYEYGTDRDVRSVDEVTDARMVVLVYFDAYCQHCQRLLYNLSASYPDLQTRGVDVVALEISGATRADLRQLRAGLGIRFHLIGDVSPFWSPTGVPYSFILVHGRVVGEVLGNDLNTIMEYVLNNS